MVLTELQAINRVDSRATGKEMELDLTADRAILVMVRQMQRTVSSLRPTPPQASVSSSSPATTPTGSKQAPRTPQAGTVTSPPTVNSQVVATPSSPQVATRRPRATAMVNQQAMANSQLRAGATATTRLPRATGAGAAAVTIVEATTAAAMTGGATTVAEEADRRLVWEVVTVVATKISVGQETTAKGMTLVASRTTLTTTPSLFRAWEKMSPLRKWQTTSSRSASSR